MSDIPNTDAVKSYLLGLQDRITWKGATLSDVAMEGDIAKAKVSIGEHKVPIRFVKRDGGNVTGLTAEDFDVLTAVFTKRSISSIPKRFP